jgi:hypothetical protein
MKEDPARWTGGEGGDELAQALRAATSDVLSDEAVARVRAGLTAAGIGAAAAATTTAVAKPAAAATAKVFTASSLAKAGLAIALVGGLGWGIHATIGAGATDPVVAAPPSATMMPPLATALPPVPEVAPAAAPSALPVPPASAAPAPSPARAVVAPSRPSPSSSPAAEAAREGALLLEARRVLDADPARALSIVRSCERQFPTSQLEPERARIAAEAQKRLSR